MFRLRYKVLFEGVGTVFFHCFYSAFVYNNLDFEFARIVRIRRGFFYWTVHGCNVYWGVCAFTDLFWGKNQRNVQSSHQFVVGKQKDFRRFI